MLSRKRILKIIDQLKIKDEQIAELQNKINELENKNQEINDKILKVENDLKGVKA